jgi:hypothetical protein
MNAEQAAQLCDETFQNDIAHEPVLMLAADSSQEL